ncbi:MAG TPA: hypothetical protein EYG03_22210 [Planctomycetes bacterium]|nr:hypothetical protein [Fuerstiella sp.]HIK94667.1 hypothetical protein [Planctomycetota bacterium]
MNDSSNPYQAPLSSGRTPRWKIDRSGAGRRILEMIGVSITGVFLGELLPRFPGYVYNPGGLGGLVCLGLWIIVRAFVMWRNRQQLILPESNAPATLHRHKPIADVIDTDHS